jgi:hypothetical protein
MASREDRIAALVLRGRHLAARGGPLTPSFRTWLAANPESELHGGETDAQAVELSRADLRLPYQQQVPLGPAHTIGWSAPPAQRGPRAQPGTRRHAALVARGSQVPRSAADRLAEQRAIEARVEAEHYEQDLARVEAELNEQILAHHAREGEEGPYERYMAHLVRQDEEERDEREEVRATVRELEAREGGARWHVPVPPPYPENEDPPAYDNPPAYFFGPP